mgnify:CR=1 FL=1
MEPRKRGRFRALLRYTKGYRIPIILSFVLMFAELVIGFISPLVLSITIDSVLDTKPVNVAWYFRWFVPMVGGIENIRAHPLVPGRRHAGHDGCFRSGALCSHPPQYPRRRGQRAGPP